MRCMFFCIVVVAVSACSCCFVIGYVCCPGQQQQQQQTWRLLVKRIVCTNWTDEKHVSLTPSLYPWRWFSVVNSIILFCIISKSQSSWVQNAANERCAAASSVDTRLSVCCAVQIIWIAIGLKYVLRSFGWAAERVHVLAWLFCSSVFKWQMSFNNIAQI